MDGHLREPSHQQHRHIHKYTYSNAIRRRLHDHRSQACNDRPTGGMGIRLLQSMHNTHADPNTGIYYNAYRLDRSRKVLPLRDARQLQVFVRL